MKSLREAKKGSLKKKKFSSPPTIKAPVPKPASYQSMDSGSEGTKERPREPLTRNHLEESVNYSVDKRVEERISEFFNKIANPNEFIKMWELHKEKQNAHKVGFARFLRGVSIRDTMVQETVQEHQQTKVFHTEELIDSQHDFVGQIGDMCA